MSIEDEKILDGYEGVDGAARETGLEERPTEQGEGRHNKLYLEVEIEEWKSRTWQEKLGSMRKRVKVLVYPDEYRPERGTIRQNYIGRMNRAIREAVALGLSEEWVERVVRPWVPEGIEAPEGYVGEKDKQLIENTTR
ncbi:hypothetical protein CC80DRAFT_39509 [Byssothecium circinans]|uniref:Uncharacterized protein n=1 Tax=Byssothecium circinans TaxID=147558 RepID=A0A6A5U4X1_9PLEO|nr:hypothetical protein CC80DRAFT_39509 [Byssothecium circinans]